MFNNIPPVTKNILLINVTLYIVSLVLVGQGIDLFGLLSAKYFNSLFFEPYQIVTHMFMHSQEDFFHLFFNMFALFMFGSHLERIWGGKRFFVFYIASGLGAVILYNSIGVWQIMELKQQLIGMGYDMGLVNVRLLEGEPEKILVLDGTFSTLQSYATYNWSNMVGASGAIFGLLAGFAILFPNTELMLLFPPIPIKAKYLIGAYMVFEIYSSFYRPGDGVAHLAHVGGAIVGAAFVLYWRKKGKNFY
jgi:membrane associated rhomboid family serine protease